MSILLARLGAQDLQATFSFLPGLSTNMFAWSNERPASRMRTDSNLDGLMPRISESAVSYSNTNHCCPSEKNTNCDHADSSCADDVTAKTQVRSSEDAW